MFHWLVNSYSGLNDSNQVVFWLRLTKLHIVRWMVSGPGLSASPTDACEPMILMYYFGVQRWNWCFEVILSEWAIMLCTRGIDLYWVPLLALLDSIKFSAKGMAEGVQHSVCILGLENRKNLHNSNECDIRTNLAHWDFAWRSLLHRCYSPFRRGSLSHAFLFGIHDWNILWLSFEP